MDREAALQQETTRARSIPAEPVLYREKEGRRGVLATGVVYGTYAVERQFVVLTRQGQPRTYSPYLHAKDLVEALRSLAYASEDEIGAETAAFANGFGFLGWGLLTKKRKRRLREPIRWIRAHANTIRLIIEGAALLHEGRDVGEPELNDLLGKDLAIGGTLFRFNNRNWARIVYPRRVQLRQWIAHFLSENLAGVSRRVFLDQGRFDPSFLFTAPIQAAYWHLADVLSRRRPEFVRCLVCQKVFVRTDKRQRFCPKILAPGEHGESRCGGWYRQRRKRRQPVSR
jgi:hypothetical protein